MTVRAAATTRVERIEQSRPVGFPAAEPGVHHDVRAWYAFAGDPRSEIRRRAAPRLAAALEKLDPVLGVPAVPGGPTHFGVAEGYRIHPSEHPRDGRGPDRADEL
ncbi:hypothetical protein ACIGXM_05985 [Kitasatospora sp. NPDC052896]|uniref:hypothetical protein n=1 Tax=Kitasatospora sp. NPDC052896 TaxID=3364061 RepID=UPI0037C8AAD7